MKVNLLTIGDEILIGQIVDTNSAWMAKQLNLIGAEVNYIYTIGDTEKDILSAIDQSFEHADVVLMTGGLGPTKDDITKKTIAQYFQVPLEFDQGTYDRILKLFERWGRSTTEAHRLQCYMPANATLLFNKMGTAPGMWFEKEGKVLVSMPGVPYEMKYLMEKAVIPKLQLQFPGSPIAHRTILTVGEGESRIADRINDFEEALPSNIKLAYLPGLGRVRLRLTGRGTQQENLAKILDQEAQKLKAIIPELVFGEGQLQLEEVIGQMLLDRKLSISTAESCTGGYIAHLFTSIAGSSRYFQGSIVAYDNAIKKKLLGVNPVTLEEQGAVSEATVKEMVTGALQALETDIAIAISGIAGPGGGTPQKPVGTVWIAVGDGKHTETYLLSAGKDRIKNIQYSAIYALDQIRKFLLKYY
ncbi:MAG: competence/damage-inducible protein A [Saprospiraceae bacterium]